MCFGFDGDGALQRSLEQRGVSRRSLIRGAAAGAAALGVSGALAAPAAADGVRSGRGHGGGRRVPADKISIQLYTLRSVMTGAGVDATLAKLAQIGYDRVELAGLYGRTAEDIRGVLDGLGIRSNSSHDGLSSSFAALETKFDNSETLGVRYLNVPYLASSSLSDWQAWADQMNNEAAAAKRRGFRYGYHNHAHEFTTDLGGGVTPWDVFMRELDPAYVHLEVDLYWAVTGGVNLGMSSDEAIDFAIDVVDRAPLQVRQYHVKDRNEATGDHVDLGTGFIDFAKIFRAHQVEDYIVENDSPDVTPIQTAEVGYSYLRGLRY